MTHNELSTVLTSVEQEIGKIPLTVVTDNEFEKLTGKRLAGAPYKLVTINGKTYLGVKFTGKRSERTVKRFVYQALGEFLWPNIPAWKNRWFGTVMAQTEEMPKDRDTPNGARPRSELKKLAVAQTKRIAAKQPQEAVHAQ
jgi:hypothetical protein